jgi:hypothetical protein
MKRVGAAPDQRRAALDFFRARLDALSEGE